MPSTTAEVLAAYRTDLLAAGLPEPLTDAIVLSYADRLHAGDVPATPPGVDDEMTPGEFEAAREASRARRAAELAEVG